LLDAARRLEPLDAAMARETHLEAMAAALFAGRLGGTPDVREVAAAAQAAAPAPGQPRAIDLLLDGLATRFTEGYPAGVPPLRKALDAFRHAYEVPPHDARHRIAFAQMSRRLASRATQRGDHDEAISLLRGAVEATPDDAYAWLELSAAYSAIGKPTEASAALAEAKKRQPGAPP